jgi:hypothetical protein
VQRKAKHRFMFNNVSVVFRKFCRLYDNVEIYCTAGEAAYDKMAHAHWMLENKCYRHTLKICNKYCFSTSIMVTRKRLDVALYFRYLSCHGYLLLFCVCDRLVLLPIRLTGGDRKAAAANFPLLVNIFVYRTSLECEKIL